MLQVSAMEQPLKNSFSASALAAKRSRLLARIHRRYATATETHAVGPLRLSFTRVADPDVVLDRIVEEEDRREKITGQRRDGNELHLPYWAELWESARGVGEWLVENMDKGTSSVLDLGCGMGFAGMVAVAMGAKVLLADLETDALLFARLNTLPWSDQVRVRQINWQTDKMDESFDLILGADLVYDRTQWEFIERFFEANLNRSGRILLAEPGRQTGDMFPTWIRQRGWELEEFQQQISTRAKAIRIFRLTRAKK
jgi:predicted nicotinamide N-methyase